MSIQQLKVHSVGSQSRVGGPDWSQQHCLPGVSRCEVGSPADCSVTHLGYIFLFRSGKECVFIFTPIKINNREVILRMCLWFCNYPCFTANVNIYRAPLHLLLEVKR